MLMLVELSKRAQLKCTIQLKLYGVGPVDNILINCRRTFHRTMVAILSLQESDHTFLGLAHLCPN